MSDVLVVGKLDKNIYKCITEDIATDEVIITDTQIKHIQERHPEAYNKTMNEMKLAIENPDYIILDANHPNTGLVVKRPVSNNTNMQIVLRVATSNDKNGLKNSIISYWNISDKRLRNYLRNKPILYKKE